MAFKYRSLREALEGEQLTQGALAEKVTRLRRKRKNGTPLKLSQSFVSELANGERAAGRDLARAISDVLDRTIDPTVLVFGEAA
jgi:hypothetical protein